MGRWELIHLFFLFCIIQYLSYGDVVDSTRWEVKVHGHTLSKHGKKDKQTLDCSKIGKWCPSVGTKIFGRDKVRKSDPKNIKVDMKFAENCTCWNPDKKKKFCKELLLQGGGESFFITSIEIRHLFRSWICTTKIQKFQDFISPCVVQANCTETPRVQNKALCYSGWINVNDSCYRIINRKTDIHEAMNNCYDDLTMETEITEELRNQIGYDENVWIRKNGSIQACNLGNLSCTTSGRFNSLCSMAMLNDSMILDEPVRFFEAPWMIPNTKKSLDIIKKQYSISSPQDGMWIGLYKSGNQLFWIDNSFVSETEKRFLNISDSLTEGECAMYKGSVILTDCSLRKRGLTLPLLSVPCCSCAPRPPRNTSEFKKGLKEISVKKKETSKYKRSKTSAPDERTSSKAIATVAALVISIPFAAIVISDIPILTYQFREFCRNVRRRFQRTES